MNEPEETEYPLGTSSTITTCNHFFTALHWTYLPLTMERHTHTHTHYHLNPPPRPSHHATSPTSFFLSTTEEVSDTFHLRGVPGQGRFYDFCLLDGWIFVWDKSFALGTPPLY